MTGLEAWVALTALGGVGAVARAGLTRRVDARWKGRFPLGTFVVNVSGAGALGVLYGLDVTGDAMLILATGLLGGYTTFSTWMAESEGLGEERAWWDMCLNLGGALVVGLLATVLGWLAGSWAD
jgi:fluoride exporter